MVTCPCSSKEEWAEILRIMLNGGINQTLTGGGVI